MKFPTHDSPDWINKQRYKVEVLCSLIKPSTFLIRHLLRGFFRASSQRRLLLYSQQRRPRSSRGIAYTGHRQADTMSNVGTVKHIPKDVRYAFLQQAAPASYVAGLGRG